MLQKKLHLRVEPTKRKTEEKEQVPGPAKTYPSDLYKINTTPMVIPGNLDAAAIRSLIRQKKILLGGNRKLRIYGTFDCRSGKKMNKENRVFFTSEKQALANGYRPCGHCMNQAYQKWKHGPVQ